MKVRAVANGDVIDLPENSELIAAGIYESVEETKNVPTKPSTPSTPSAPKPATPPSTTKVEPLTTNDVPTPPKTVPPAAGKPTRRPKGK
jgi:hypothetical protein